MRLKTRLQRLVTRLGLEACPECRDRRGQTILVDWEENEDGSVKQPEGMPVPCERCGEIPEEVIWIKEVVVPSPVPRGDATAEVAERFAVSPPLTGEARG